MSLVAVSLHVMHRGAIEFEGVSGSPVFLHPIVGGISHIIFADDVIIAGSGLVWAGISWMITLVGSDPRGKQSRKKYDL